MSVKFEWDHKKAGLNLKKHGISFNEARTVFQDPLALIFDDEAHSGQGTPRNHNWPFCEESRAARLLY